MTMDGNLTTDEKAIDVSGQESQAQVQCLEIRLLRSNFEALPAADDSPESSRFLFRIRAQVNGQVCFSNLDVEVILVGEEDEHDQVASVYRLQFTLSGIFVSAGEINQVALGEFARLYTLSIIWPYAREYASDQFRRAGESFDSLPVINPQVVTDSLINADLVEVSYAQEE